MTNFSAKVLPALSIDEVEAVNAHSRDTYISLGEASSLPSGVKIDIIGIAASVAVLTRKMSIYRETYPVEVNTGLTTVEYLQFSEAFFANILLMSPDRLTAQLGDHFCDTLAVLNTKLAECCGAATGTTSLSAIAGGVHAESVALMQFAKGIVLTSEDRLPKAATTFEQIVPFANRVRGLASNETLFAAREQYPLNPYIKLFLQAVASLDATSNKMVVMWEENHDKMVSYEKIHEIPLSTIKHDMETMFNGVMSCHLDLNQFAANYYELSKTMRDALAPASNPNTSHQENINMSANNNTNHNDNTNNQSGGKTSREQSFDDKNDTAAEAEFVEVEVDGVEPEDASYCEKVKSFFRRHAPSRKTVMWSAAAVAATAGVVGGVWWLRRKNNDDDQASTPAE